MTVNKLDTSTIDDCCVPMRTEGKNVRGQRQTDMAEQRLHELIEVALKSNMDSPCFVPEKFFWVFGNLVQEYLADRIYEKIRNEKDLGRAIREAFRTADLWFGRDDKNWLFHREWLREYVKWRFVGSRKGTAPENKREGGKQEFLKKQPKSEATCGWYLGCPEKNNLEIDHILSYSTYGSGTSGNLQWLCEKHNKLWKKTLLFWGENYIPFREYKIDDRPQ